MKWIKTGRWCSIGSEQSSLCRALRWFSWRTWPLILGWGLRMPSPDCRTCWLQGPSQVIQTVRGAAGWIQNWPPVCAGVIDDRGKFIFITPEELDSVAHFIRQRGRVSITELAQASNSLINLVPESRSAAWRTRGPLDSEQNQDLTDCGTQNLGSSG